MRRQVFVSAVGQDDNVGDSLLRRGLLAALQSIDDVVLHVEVGRNSDDYIDGLGIREVDIRYRSRDEWMTSFDTEVGRGDAVFISNAGEIQVERALRLFGRRTRVLLAAALLKGTPLVHTGVGIRNPGRPSALTRMLTPLRAFRIVSWRDAPSRDFAGRGGVHPDWAFAAGPKDLASMQRGLLAVSVRRDRGELTAAWVASVRALAKARGLDIAVVAQVGRDSDGLDALAARLGAVERSDWGHQGHRAEERRVREMYRRSQLVVSNRLHALIAGATEGAYPVGLTPGSPEKLARTLAPAGLARAIATTEEFDPSVIPHGSDAEMAVWAGVSQARIELEGLSRRIRTLIEES